MTLGIVGEDLEMFIILTWLILEHFGKVYSSFILATKTAFCLFVCFFFFFFNFNLHHSVLFPISLMELHTRTCMFFCLFVCMNVYVLNVICKRPNLFFFFFFGLGSVLFKKFDVVSFRQLFVILWVTTKVVNWDS